MNFRIADTFSDSLAKLNDRERKRSMFISCVNDAVINGFAVLPCRIMN